MKTLDPRNLSTKELHGFLLTAIAPRPIGFISTKSRKGISNLAPFSFFNVFSANPPIMIFSPARRVRDNTTKDTLVNCRETRQAVVNVVNYDMVQQMSLASSEYHSETDEFKKAGFTPIDSVEIDVPRVAESPVQFECEIDEIKELGDQGGAGNLILARVVKIHVHSEFLNEDGQLDPLKLDLVARMGGALYSRALTGAFEIPKPLSHLGIGFDNISKEIKESELISSNAKALLAGVEELPDTQTVNKFVKDYPEYIAKESDKKHKFAADLLEEQRIIHAWCVLLQ